MSEHDSGLSRRGFLTTAGAAAAVGAGVVATGGVAGAQGNGDGTGGGGGNGSGGNGSGAAQPGGQGKPIPTYTSIKDSPETWEQPWVFRPDPATDNVLNLVVVEHQNKLLFSYGGASPGPTVRMGGAETLRVHLENTLGLDAGLSTVGPNPAPNGIPGPEGRMIKALAGSRNPLQAYGGTPENPVMNKIPTEPVEDWCLGEHVNGVHTAHVTNLHTHGLHVLQGKHEDNGTHSDNIYLRVVPTADYERMVNDPSGCFERLQEALEKKRGEILPGSAEYEFRLGNTASTPVHPPGTHWYHPHSHGSTHTQVSSGMAGFLIVEGDVDAVINEALAGSASADPGTRTGQWNYRERTMFVQRIIVNQVTSDPDEDRSNISPTQGANFQSRVNGQGEPNVIVMAPNAIERWRILNGSVDGSGFLRVMVLEGRFESDGQGAAAKLYRVTDGEVPELVEEEEWAGLIKFTADGKTTTENIGGPNGLKQQLFQLSTDGVTLVRPAASGGAEYYIKDLNTTNGGNEPAFKNLSECWDGENSILCYERPNEVVLAPANRSDVLFQAPADGPKEYTVIGLPSKLHATHAGASAGFAILAHVVVRGDAVEGDANVKLADLKLPKAPDYLAPVTDADLEITPAERAVRPGLTGTYRTRTVRYAGWGIGGFPRIDVPADVLAANPNLNKLQYYVPPAPNTPGLQMPAGAAPVDISDLQPFGVDELPTMIVPANTRTMSVDGHKFEPSSETTPAMWVDTAEEWAVYNDSIECYSITTKHKPEDVSEDFAAENANEAAWYTYKDPSGNVIGPQLWGHGVSYPLRRNDIADVNAKGDRGKPGKPALIDNLQTAAADHPFHIHQNPFWLMRLEVPNNDGDLVNVLPEPRWADVTYLPRNGGRAIFRSRFDDYVGEYVNHCHILLHEDNGMMQRVEVVPSPADGGVANYDGSDAVASADASVAAVSDLYPPRTLDEMWQACASFLEDNNSGQKFPLESGWLPDPPDPLSHV